MMNAADGSGQTALTDFSDSCYDNPAWSPDGTKIAFDLGDQVYVMNAEDGSGQTKLTEAGGSKPDWGVHPLLHQSTLTVNAVSINPNGEALHTYTKIFRSFDGIILQRGFTPATFTGISGAAYAISVSNNLGSEVFDHWEDGSPDSRRTITLSAAGNTAITAFYKTGSSDINGKVAFTSDRGDGSFDIYAMNATDASGQADNISSNNDAILESDPSWSPDGTKIAFSSDKGGNTEIYFINADGSGQTNLTNNPAASDAEPDWGTLPSTSAKQSTLNVNSVDLSGKPVDGLWTVIRTSLDGNIIKTGFTPLTFTGNSGTEYKVSVANYDGKIFQRWEDASISNTQMITLTEDMMLTATYDTGDSLRGFTSLTYTGTAEQPDLTVNAAAIDDGNRTLHMWTIIDPQSSDAAGTTHKVYAGNYRDIVFDRWSDGNADRIRTLTIAEATTLTAYYKMTTR